MATSISSLRADIDADALALLTVHRLDHNGALLTQKGNVVRGIARQVWRGTCNRPWPAGAP